jgi:hypothetical protein
MQGEIVFELKSKTCAPWTEMLRVTYSIKDTLDVIGENAFEIIEDQVEEMVKSRWDIPDPMSEYSYNTPFITISHSPNSTKYVATVKTRGTPVERRVAG